MTSRDFEGETMNHELGDRVQVCHVRLEGEAKFLGKQGTIVEVETIDIETLIAPVDPLYVVSFDDETPDWFFTADEIKSI